MNKLVFNNTPCQPKHKSTIVVLKSTKKISYVFPVILDHWNH